MINDKNLLNGDKVLQSRTRQTYPYLVRYAKAAFVFIIQY